jgi:DNA-binding NtrC family response regulator
MVRVLVVDHDVDLADLRVDTLRRAGFEVDQCAGPTHALTACPVMRGLPCWQVEWADVLVYDEWAAGFSGGELAQNLHELYPGKAIVLTSQGTDLGSAPDDLGATVLGSRSRGALVSAVETAHAARAAQASSIVEGLPKQ